MRFFILALTLLATLPNLRGQLFTERPNGVGPNLFAPVIADLNGDSLPDFIGNDFVPFGGILGMRLVRNSTVDSLDFTDEGYIAGNFLPAGIPTVGDFDGDGDMDIISSQEETDSLFLLINDGAAGFMARGLGLAKGANIFATGDFNGDGLLDFGGYSSKRFGFWVYLNQGNAAFTQAGYTVDSNSPNSIEVADFNNDGRDDIMLNQAAFSFTDKSTYVFISDENGVPEQTFSVRIPNTERGVIADLNNDGIQDIILATRNAIFPIFGTASGEWTFGAFTSIGFSNLRAVSVADYDGDGRTDFVVADRNDGMLFLRRTEDDNAFTFVRSEIGNLVQPFSVAAADLDRDGDLDFVGSSAGVTRYYENIISEGPPVSTTEVVTLTEPAFPNPVRAVLNLPGLPAGAEQAFIYAASGRLVAVQSIVRGQLDVRELPSGSFQLLIPAKHKTVAVRFVKVE